MAEILDETDLQILKTLQKNAKLNSIPSPAVYVVPPPPIASSPFLSVRNGWRKKGISRNM